MIVLAIIILINLFILQQTREPEKFIQVKEKYRILREHIRNSDDDTFKMIQKPVPLTGMLRMNDSVGYNTNKGAEIVLCLDGDVNDIFHVLIHELAHCTVNEYSHSDKFWDNYAKLRDMCVEIGIYEQITDKKEFCGQHIQDK